MSEIGSRIELKTDYETAIARATTALKAEGFGVLTTIDGSPNCGLAANAQAKIERRVSTLCHSRRCDGVHRRNPPLAHRALNTDLDVGLLLPCNVIVYEENGGAVVSIVDPLSMLGVIANPALESVANEARAKLQRVAAQLRASR